MPSPSPSPIRPQAAAPITTLILRRRQVEHQSGYSRSTIYLRIAQGLWTRPVRLGARAVGWPAIEVAALNAARIAGNTDHQLRQLVIDLLEARKTSGTPASARQG